jgi:hypothetical protein
MLIASRWCLILLLAAVLSPSAPSRADEIAMTQCHRVVQLLDRYHELEREDPFDESSPEYFVHMAEKGSVTISCGTGPVDVVVGVSVENPSSQFMSFFGRLAHDAAGVNASDAVDAALQCHKAILQFKGTKGGLFEGDPIVTRTLHVDCRSGNSFTSFGVYHP